LIWFLDLYYCIYFTLLYLGIVPLFGCKEIIAIDIDEDALEIAQKNWDSFSFDQPIHFLKGNLEEITFEKQCLYLGEEKLYQFENVIDVVITNPPFGTKKKGIDILFLQKALQISKVVYSLHKTSTRQFVLKKAKEWGAIGKVVAELRYDIPQMYKFHKKESLDIQVDFIRFTRQT